MCISSSNNLTILLICQVHTYFRYLGYVISDYIHALTCVSQNWTQGTSMGYVQCQKNVPVCIGSHLSIWIWCNFCAWRFLQISPLSYLILFEIYLYILTLGTRNWNFSFFTCNGFRVGCKNIFCAAVVASRRLACGNGNEKTLVLLSKILIQIVI
jgi:hypothetical protein